MIRVKDESVQVSQLSTGALLALIVADQVFTSYGYETVITSGNDGNHSYTSLHYNNDALDLRMRHVKESQKQEIAEEISLRLGLDWDVLLEIDHLHLEKQPRHRI